MAPNALIQGVDSRYAGDCGFRIASAATRRLRVLVSEREFVAKDIEAGNAIFAFFIVPLTLAAFFAAGDFALRGNSAGEFNAEIEVSANAFPVRAIETKNGFGVFEIGFVFHAAVAGDAFGVEILEVDGERLQLRIFFGDAD